MRRNSLILILLSMILAIVLILFLLSLNESPASKSSLLQSKQIAPAYLLLSNWKDGMLYIATGITIPNSTLNGEQGSNTSIQDIFFNGKIYPQKIFVDYGRATSGVRLTLNNTILIDKNDSSFGFVFPPYENRFLIVSVAGNNTFLIQGALNYSIIGNASYKEIHSGGLYLFTSGNATIKANPENLTIFDGKFLEVSIENSTYSDPDSLINYSENEVHDWLLRSKNVSLPEELLKEYYLSLLLIKDDQNPITGEFVASPEPVYFYSWARDSSFSAMALQSSGHINSALKYWNFLAGFMKNQTFYTRFNFWNGMPDQSYGIPEYDSIGLFQIGIYGLYRQTGNLSLLNRFLGAINSTVNWESKNIDSFGLLPQDLSIWEDNLAYNFWTQAIDSIGLKDTVDLYSSVGLNNSLPLILSREINISLQKNFYQNGFFVQSLSRASEYVNGSNKVILIANPVVDSSTILPLAYGLLPLNSTMVRSSIEKINATLNVNGGLSRFPNDDYHFSSDLYDSSSPSPPWIITTLFMAYYYEDLNETQAALQLLNFSLIHSNNGMLPEALDPKTLMPLPTTAPLTWSAAMYVLASLNFH